MSLYKNMMEPCILMTETRTDDGEGGWVKTWSNGPEFLAAIIRDNSTEAKIAEANGVTAVYTITTPKATALEYHDVIKRKSDGAIFRITTDGGEKTAPAGSTLDIAQVSAEKWSLTT